jgi:hypothetical protein
MTNIFDKDEMKKQTGGIVSKNPSLQNVIPVEDYILQTAPLPITYDVNRPQNWYFNEYTYTEFMGGIAISPMNDEMACRNIISAMKNQSTFDVEQAIYDRLEKNGTLDKYTLTDMPSKKWKHVIVLPGTNLLPTHISKEIISRLMWEHGDNIALKPHPLTHEQDVTQMGKDFGKHRVIPANVSGWEVIKHADTVYTTSSTELAMYACLFGKTVKTIGSIFFERTGSYYPTFMHIAGESSRTARKNLLKILKSNSSGIVFGEDPNYEEKVDTFFKQTLKLRNKFKPIVYNSFSYPNRNVKKEEQK